MERLLKELIPHAPDFGLYVHPHIPATLLRNATSDYAPEMATVPVIALLDLTFLKNGRDGALFGTDRMVFQNHNLQAPQSVFYREIVDVEKQSGLLKGHKLVLSINRARATFPVTMDLSSRKKALRYLHKFFLEVMLVAD